MKLIFTADDYGAHPGIDKGVVDAASKGWINSVAVFSNCDRDQCKRNIDNLLSKASGQCDVGVHLTISSGKSLTNAHYFCEKNSDRFKGYARIRRPPKKERDKEKAQLVVELRAQLDRLLEATENKVRHISVHHNTLYYIQEYFEILLELAIEYNLPVRSVNAKPSFKHELFVGQMAFRMAWPNLFQQKDIDHIDQFAKEISLWVKNREPKPFMPDYFNASHYGPIGIWKVTDGDWRKVVRKKNATLRSEVNQILQMEETHEFGLHIMDADYRKLDGYRALKVNGIDNSYFDSRMAEMKSLEKLSNEFAHHFAPWPAMP